MCNHERLQEITWILKVDYIKIVKTTEQDYKDVNEITTDCSRLQ